MWRKLLFINLLCLTSVSFAQQQDLTDLGRKITVSLKNDEEIGGYTISQYVGKDDSFLMKRLKQSEITTSGTFSNLEAANKAVEAVIAANRHTIANWWKSNTLRQAFSATVNTKARIINRYLFEKDGITAHSYEISQIKVRVVLAKKNDNWFVFIAYPEP
jgi:hypothetical protein